MTIATMGSDKAIVGRLGEDSRPAARRDCRSGSTRRVQPQAFQLGAHRNNRQSANWLIQRSCYPKRSRYRGFRRHRWHRWHWRHWRPRPNAGYPKRSGYRILRRHRWHRWNRRHWRLRPNAGYPKRSRYRILRRHRWHWSWRGRARRMVGRHRLASRRHRSHQTRYCEYQRKNQDASEDLMCHGITPVFFRFLRLLGRLCCLLRFIPLSTV